MIRRTPFGGALRGRRQLQLLRPGVQACRRFQISATPTAESPALNGDVLSTAIDSSAGSADAQFEVLGAPYSLLSVSLSASQRLYTRRGTLVGLSGKAENVSSTLSILEPIRRVVLGIPFLYQKISSTSPITALISTKSPLTSFTVLHLDGTVDWMVTQRKALLAWTGHKLSVSPTINRSMSIAHWGNSTVAGRGLVALAGPGQVYQVQLKSGEEYVAHPGNVVAYTINQHLPLPYRLKSVGLRLQVPNTGLSKYLPDVKFFRVMMTTKTWKAIANFLFKFRTTLRRSIWGDRLFLSFKGPMTLLVSTRASRISDVLTARDVDEIADSPTGAVQEAVALAGKPKEQIAKGRQFKDVPTGFSYAEVKQGGKVEFEAQAGKA